MTPRVSVLMPTYKQVHFIRRANWDDFNYPARIATMVAAELPLLQYDNAGAIVATQTLALQHNIGLFFTDMHQLREQLTDHARMTDYGKVCGHKERNLLLITTLIAWWISSDR